MVKYHVQFVKIIILVVGGFFPRFLDLISCFSAPGTSPGGKVILSPIFFNDMIWCATVFNKMILLTAFVTAIGVFVTISFREGWPISI